MSRDINPKRPKWATITSSEAWWPDRHDESRPEATKVGNDHFQGGRRKALDILDGLTAFRERLDRQAYPP